MDVKSAFLDRFIEEKVYVEQPSEFVDHVHSDYVFKLDKALYGFKKTSRARYDMLSNFLLNKGFA